MHVQHIPSVIKCQPFYKEIITEKARAKEALEQVRATGAVHGLDFETTSLDPRDGHVRITSIYGPAGWFVIDHFKAGSFDDLVDRIAAAASYCVFNIGFEGRWFDDRSYGAATLFDVAFMPKAKLGGGFNMTLAQMAKRDLQIEMDKELQASNWNAPELTADQYSYAADDPKVTFELWNKWLEELTPEQYGGFIVFNDSWRATVEAEDTGLQLDTEYHKTVLDYWTRRRDVAERYVRKYAPKELLDNCNSDIQLGAFFREHILDDQSIREWPVTGKTKQMQMSSEVLTGVARLLPYPINRWVAALLIMRKSNKYISTYGQKLIDMQNRIGRIKARFNIAAAATGRYSSSAENLQNIPRSFKVRRSFVCDSTLPMNRDSKYRYVLADYSSVEVRVLAAISGDTALMHEAIYGDVHAASAADLIRVPVEEFKAVLADKKHKLYSKYKSLRSKAKAITFSVCYGSGIPSMARKMRVTEAEALEAFNAWAKRYPKAFAYRQVMYEKLMATGYIQVADGRSIYVFKDDRTLPVASNYGIQGAAASVMYRAMYHVHRLLVAADIPCRIGATVHDELILRSRVECSEQALEILQNGMALGWLDIFPGTSTDHLADGVIGLAWSDKP